MIFPVCVKTKAISLLKNRYQSVKRIWTCMDCKEAWSGILTLEWFSVTWENKIFKNVHTHTFTYMHLYIHIHAKQCRTFHCVAVQSNRTSGARSKRLTRRIKSSASQRMQLKETGESWQRIRFWRWEWKIRQVMRRGSGIQWIYCQQNERILGYLNVTYLQPKFWWKDLLVRLISLSWSWWNAWAAVRDHTVLLVEFSGKLCN